MIIDKSQMPWAYKGDDVHEPRFEKVHHNCHCDPSAVASEGYVQRKIEEHDGKLCSHHDQFRRVYDRIEEVRKQHVSPETIRIFDEFGAVKNEIKADMTVIDGGKNKRLLSSDDDRIYGERFYLHNQKIDGLDTRVKALEEGGVTPGTNYTFDSNFTVSPSKLVSLSFGTVSAGSTKVVSGDSVNAAIATVTAQIPAAIDSAITAKNLASKTYVDESVAEAVKDAQSHYKFVQNTLEHNSFITMKDFGCNTFTYSRDISFERYDFTYNNDKYGFFYYDRNQTGITGVTIVPSFIDQTLASYTDEIYIQNSMPTFPFQLNQTKDTTTGNIKLVILLDGGANRVVIDTGVSDDSAIDVKFSDDGGEYTSVITIAEAGGISKYYTLTEDGQLHQHTVQPYFEHYITTTTSKSLTEDISVVFDFAVNTFKVVTPYKTFEMKNSAITSIYNAVFVPRKLKNQSMRQFTFALKMANACQHNVKFLTKDDEEIQFIDKYNFFADTYLKKLKEDVVYFRIQEVKPAVFMVELMGVPPAKIDETFEPTKIFDLESTDWDFRKSFSAVWKALGGTSRNE